MDTQKIVASCDHTLLTQTATWSEIKSILDDAIKYNTASACIPPSYVKRAKQYVKDAMRICTVIGFPNGYSTTETKVFETKNAIENGADEIDMVINIGDLKDGNYNVILNEIKAVKHACKNKILKVIIETCLLTDDEKIMMCHIISDSGADYIKTSTGFSTAGATIHDIEIFSQNISKNVKMKAAGGIKTLEDADEFIKLGCSRLGTSRIIKLVKQNKENKNDTDTSY